MSAIEHAAVRESAIAGTWYPGSAPALRRTVEGYLAQVEPVLLPGRPLALVSPHAGYAYSGPTAAHAYAQLQGQTYSRVLLIGPLHRPIPGSRLGAFMVPGEDAYRTPLGDVPIDRAFIAELGKRVTLTAVQHDQEHSLEIELPFLQVALDNPSARRGTGFSVVPIMAGEHISDPGAAAHIERLAGALAALCADGETLLVASTDLSHLDNYADVVRIDRRLVDLVAAFDVEGMISALQAGQVQACGAVGLAVVLRAAQKLGARGAQVLAYAASGDVTGNKRPGTYTVGYLAAAAYV
jgi:AmmeMemoRadiSam system protein B